MIKTSYLYLDEYDRDQTEISHTYTSNSSYVIDLTTLCSNGYEALNIKFSKQTTPAVILFYTNTSISIPIGYTIKVYSNCPKNINPYIYFYPYNSNTILYKNFTTTSISSVYVLSNNSIINMIYNGTGWYILPEEVSSSATGQYIVWS